MNNGRRMTNKELNELAGFAAKFLGMLSAHPNSYVWPKWLKDNVEYYEWIDHPNEDNLQHSLFKDGFASILAHIAKRKMEDMGWEWVASVGDVGPKYVWNVYTGKHRHDGEDDNEYVALWLAIREAVGK